MTHKFVFVGHRAEVLTPKPILFTEFGQEVELDSELAHELIASQNIPLIPIEAFAATEGAADRPFAARTALHQIREALRETPAQESEK